MREVNSVIFLTFLNHPSVSANALPSTLFCKEGSETGFAIPSHKFM